METFAQLEIQGNVTAEQVSNLLSHYAYSGSAISSRTVIALIDRTNPDEDLKQIMLTSALFGKANQEKSGNKKGIEAYKLVAEILSK